MPDEIVEFPDLRTEVAVITVNSMLDDVVGDEAGSEDGVTRIGLDVMAIMRTAVSAARSGFEGAKLELSMAGDVITIDGAGERINHDLFDKAAAFAGAVITEQVAEKDSSALVIAYHFPGDHELRPEHLVEVSNKGDSESIVTKLAIRRLHFAMYGRQDLGEVSWEEIHALSLIVDRIDQQNGGVSPVNAVKTFKAYLKLKTVPTQTAEFLSRYIDALTREFEINHD